MPLAAESMQGSHRVDFVGDKAIVRRLEIFCGYDPRIDKGDEGVRKYDRRRCEEIVETTREHMRRGSHPQFVLRHEVDGKDPPPDECVGSAEAIDIEDRDGVPYIVCDGVFKRDRFDSLIATNAMPRRSAEIWKTSGHLSEIALLGRETPRRPLPDTRFSQRGEKEVFAVPGRTDFARAESPSPATKERTMTQEEIAAMQAENARLKADNERLAKDLNAKEKDAKDTMARATNAEGERDRFAQEREAFAKRIETLESENASRACDAILDRMEKDGFAFGQDVRKEMHAELMAAPNREAKEKFFRQIGRKVPLGSAAVVDTRGTVAGSPGRPDRATIERYQREANGDKEKFAALMNKHGE